MATAAPPLGIVIPTLNEEAHLPQLLEDLHGFRIPVQIAVADGGSLDGTVREARARGVEIVAAPRGRARQLNAGASILSTDWLLFLHADTRVPLETLRSVERWISSASPLDFGTFRFSLQGRHWFWRFIEMGQRVREAVSGLAYGDQGLLLSRVLFDAVGGFPDLPLMEDLELLGRLKRRGRWVPLPAPLLSSPRRYEEGGRWAVWIRNAVLVSLYLAGVSPQRLARFYPARNPAHFTGPREDGQDPGRAPPHGTESRSGVSDVPFGVGQDRGAREGGHDWESRKDRRLLLVFAKDPAPGKVKTRLAASLGQREAAQVYREIGRSVVDGIREGNFRVRICFDPPGRGAAVRAWMDPRGLEFQPQVSGDLGNRLEAAFHEGLGEADSVVVVGTDAPGLGRWLVERAFAELNRSDLVLGPAADGGYYLLGLKQPYPSLFRDVPWSTSRVLAVTRMKARALGLVTCELPTLRDVDTVEDLEALGLRRTEEA